MKTKLALLALVSIVLLNCCKDPEPPKASSVITYKPIVSWVNDAVKVPLIYEGDTVKYQVNIKAENTISEINVYKILVGTTDKIKLEGYPKTSFTDSKNIIEKVYLPVGTTASTFKPFYLQVEVKESNGTSKTMDFDTFSELKVLKEQKGLIVEGAVNTGKSIIVEADENNLKADFSIIQTGINQGGNIEFSSLGFGTSLYILGADTLADIKSLKLFKLDQSSFDLFKYSKQFENLYKSDSSYFRYYVKSNFVQSGDIYFFKRHRINIDYYFLIKILNVNKLSNTVYSATFDAKYYNPYKF